MQIAPLMDPPLKFEIYRVPFLLEYGYDESEAFKESHMHRMRRHFDGPQGYDSRGYEKCTLTVVI
jgi:hypothetical protein